MVALALGLVAGDEGTCSWTAAASGKCVPEALDAAACTERGFDSKRLACATCDALESRLEEASVADFRALASDCRQCCRAKAAAEKWTSARLLCDAGIQDQDSDVHDFIKRKAPLFKRLEVEYIEGSKPALELEREDDSSRVLRADVGGWKSNHIFDFLTERLDESNTSDNSEDDESVGVVGAWTSEVQSCSG